MGLKWTRCNHRHALAGSYQYFWQGRRSRLWYTDPGYRDMVTRLRTLYGDSEYWVDSRRVRNTEWWQDHARRRLWVRDSALIMLELTG